MYKKENLAKLKKIDALAPEVMKAFWAFDKAAVADGAIPVKYKELIAVAVALTTQCPLTKSVSVTRIRVYIRDFSSQRSQSFQQSLRRRPRGSPRPRTKQT